MSLYIGKWGAILLFAASVLALGLLADQANASGGGWKANTTGDWDSNANVQVNTPFVISGNGVAVYNNSSTNYYGPSNGYSTVSSGESAYWINSPNGYTTSGTDPTGAGDGYVPGNNFVTVSNSLTLGYYTTAPAGGDARGEERSSCRVELSRPRAASRWEKTKMAARARNTRDIYTSRGEL